MKVSTIKSIGLFIIALFIVVFAFFLEKRYQSTQISELDLQNIQEHVDYKGNQLELVASYIVFLLENNEINSFETIQEGVQKVELDFEFIVLVYQDSDLFYWSDNFISIPDQAPKEWMEKTFLHTTNGWYLNEYGVFGTYDIFVLSVVKNDYAITNNYLSNNYVDEIKSNVEANIVIDPTLISTGIYDSRGNYIFSLSSPENKIVDIKIWPIILSYFLAIILFVFLISFRVFKLVKNKGLRYFLFFSLLIVSRVILQVYKIPIIFYEIELFKPYLFAYSNLIPSLGDVIFNILFIIPLVIHLHNESRKSLIRDEKRVILFQILAVFLITALSLFYIHIINMLASSSTLVFELHIISDLDVYTLVGLLILISISLILIVLIDSILLYIKDYIRLWWFVATLIFFFTISVVFNLADFVSAGLIAIIIIILAYCRSTYVKFQQNIVVFIVILVAAFATNKFIEYSVEQESETMKIKSVSLGNERDYVAELLLSDIAEKVRSDEDFLNLLYDYNYAYDEIYNYLISKCYNGYFENYDLQFTLCDTLTDLYVEDADINENCYNFFFNMVETIGVELISEGSYFINNANGRISYLNIFDFDLSGHQTKLFVELDSKFESEEPGYPDLLLKGEIAKSKKKKKTYAYAKYFNNELITQSGDIAFPLIFDFELVDSSAIEIITENKIRYCIYNKGYGEIVVLAKEQTSILNILTNFTYYFLLFYIIYLLGLALFKLYTRSQIIESTFRNRIIVPFLSVLLFAFVVIAVAIYFYVFIQFEQKNISIIKEKITSIEVEMQHEIGMENEITKDVEDYMYFLMTRLSNVFNIDINYYNLEGKLVSSSRSEIFEKGLIGTRMNSIAYNKMNSDELMEYVQKESIGSLTYFSIYIPFINSQGDKLGYINLPYFSRQQTLTDELNKLLAAALNIYVLLVIISILAAIFVSNQIARPLTFIKEKIKQVQLGKKNEMIAYHHNDEIGVLIHEYNRMIEEIEKSALLLANNEREMAWREMARQIAHEIKNPLTPMKLRLQYLKRAWDENEDDFDERFERFTQTMVEQIDSLSAIATSFSDFARLKEPQNEIVNLSDKIKSVLELYQDSDNLIFNLNIQESIYAYLDPEQFGRVILNLIKNAIQAIGNKKDGQISLVLEKTDDTINITITDNGKGISNDVREKIFKPNFTTKSSGMGLGLAISKRIIENSGGEISFSTIQDVGTIFYIKLPAYKLS